MTLLPTQFAQASDSGSGLGAFHVNLKDFLIQLVTFVLVLLILRKWVIPKLVATIDNRQRTLEESLENARRTEEALKQAEAHAEEILGKARQQADQALAEAKDAAAGVVSKAEQAAAERAEHIVKEAEARLSDEREKLRRELHHELIGLVADATEKIIDQKLDDKHDMSLIERAIRGIAK